MYKTVSLVLIGRMTRGKTSFIKAAYRKLHGKQGGAYSDSEDELETDSSEAGREPEDGASGTARAEAGAESECERDGATDRFQVLRWNFDTGGSAGMIELTILDTPGVGQEECIDQANLKKAKADLTELGGIHGCVLVTMYNSHMIDANALVSCLGSIGQRYRSLWVLRYNSLLDCYPYYSGEDVSISGYVWRCLQTALGRAVHPLLKGPER